jgi:RNA polymerase sigma-70 factor (ECF subfamily)
LDRLGSIADARARLGSGDLTGAATLLIEHYGPAVLKYFRLIFRDEPDAADAFSLFEEHLWRGLSTFRGESSLRTWVFRIAFNAATDIRKQAWRRRRRRLTADVANRLVDDALEPPSHLRELRALLQRLQRYLSESEQTLLIMRVEHELRWTEIAKIRSRDGRELDTTTIIKRFDRVAARLCRMARQHGLLP